MPNVSENKQSGTTVSGTLQLSTGEILTDPSKTVNEQLDQGYTILSDPDGQWSALCYAFEKDNGCLNAPRIDISLAQAQKRVLAQFPQWQHLDLRPVEEAGWCNATFRLGDHLLLKIPRAKRYEHSHLMEYRYLPRLRKHLSGLSSTPIEIPEPVALGMPDPDFPWHCSVARWIPGDTATALSARYQERFALELARFLKTLWQAPNHEGPAFFEQNFYRGAPLQVYDSESREALKALTHVIDTQKAAAVWHQATNSRWQQAPVWVHGDAFPANMLIQNQHLHAVIDFGNMCLGDPACDLVMAWTFFEGASRKAFITAINQDERIDAHTWERARGWALWKTLITLAGIKDKDSEAARQQIALIELLICAHG